MIHSVPRFSGPALIATLVLAAPWPLEAQERVSPIDFVRTSEAQRLGYLAGAVIWRDPGAIAPEDLRLGPPGVDPFFEEMRLTGVLECTWSRPGAKSGGKTPKFFCRTDEGASVRVKYVTLEGEGNREVFSTVVASRLLWALGFPVAPAYPVKVTCRDCPERPDTGEGPRGVRRYIGLVAPWGLTPSIVSGADEDQGWSWFELVQAIDMLPPGKLRDRQERDIDALTLLGVFLQHGDRKAEQHRLSCTPPVDEGAGVLQRGLETDSEQEDGPRVLVENPKAKACDGAMTVAQDVGATFGKAGVLTTDRSKMHFESWTSHSVFDRIAGGAPAEGVHVGTGCVGHLEVAVPAERGDANQSIEEAGRRHLATQFERLSREHVEALFSAGRVDVLGHLDREDQGEEAVDVEAWAAAFESRVKEIREARCAP